MTSLKFCFIIYVFCAIYIGQSLAAISSIQDWLRNRSCTPGQAFEERRNITQGDYVQLECSVQEVNVRFNCSFIRHLNIRNVEKLIFVDKHKNPINDSDCEGIKNADGIFDIKLNRSFGQCLSDFRVTHSEDYFYVDYILYVMPNFHNLIVTRDDWVYIYFSCVYGLRRNVSLTGLPSKPIKKEIQNPDEKEDIMLSLYRYNDSNFNVLESSAFAKDGEKVYLGTCMKFDSQRFNFVLQGQECWATPNNNSNNPIRYTFIRNGLPVAEAGNPTTIYRNYQDGCFQFSFTSFHWINVLLLQQRIYTFCNICVCDNTVAANNCTNRAGGAPGRKRRNDGEARSSGALSTRRITYGPILVTDQDIPGKEEVCDKNTMGCQFDCAIRSSGSRHCVCPFGEILASDGRSCIRPEASMQRVDENAQVNQAQFVLLLNNALLLFVMIFLLAVVVSKCKKSAETVKV